VADARDYWVAASDLKKRFNRDWWNEDEGFYGLALDSDKRLVTTPTSNVGHCLTTGIIDTQRLPRVVGRLFAPDMFSGWGIRTMTSRHPSYNPLSYHLGSVWAVENATIAFGLRRFGFNARMVDLAEALLVLAERYPGYRVPECIGGYPRDESQAPGAFPIADPMQTWNASAYPLLVQSLLGLQPLAPAQMLIVDPVLPPWMPEVILRGLRVGGAVATLVVWG
jgi:glycogen debranching enzyme